LSIKSAVVFAYADKAMICSICNKSIVISINCFTNFYPLPNEIR
jgi:hypothetical protein